MSSSMEIFLLVDAFLVGIVATLAVRHGLAHFRPHLHDAEHIHKADQSVHLPPTVREKLLAEAEAHFRSVVDQAAKDLQKDLDGTAEDIKKQVEKLGDEAETKELEHYKATVVQLQEKTKGDISDIDKELADQKAQLKAQFSQDLEAEKQRLLAQMDTKLADAVGSFLLDTLQHNVDLGAQMPYLMSVLEEHKTELAQGVVDEAKT